MGDESNQAPSEPTQTKAATPPKSPMARRTAVLLVSCGLWLLYFDLLTSMPGCTPSDGTASVDGGAIVDSAAGPDAPDMVVIDSGLDAPSSLIDSGLDAPDLLDASPDAADLLDASPDAVDLLDASPDAPDLLDASLDAALPDGPVSGCVPPLTIVSVYPTGGETSATYNHDFVAIRNRTGAPLNLAGYSLQVTTGTSTFDWHVITLTGTVPASGFHLVELGAPVGASAGAAVSNPQQTDTFDLPAVGGRVAIVSGTTALTGPGPFTTVDLVGYGSTYTSESGAVTYSGATNKGMTRAVAGCTDTDHNSADLSEGAPVAYNAQFNPPSVCACN